MDILWGEHRVIEQVIAVLLRISERTARDRAIPVEDARAALDLLRTFADRCHHGKEEHLLFPAMERAAGAGYGPTATMRAEHVTGRDHIAQMTTAVDASNPDAFVSAAKAYGELLRTHIEKEDHCLFSFARELLDQQAQDELVAAFHRVEHEDLGSGVHERMLATADRLADAYSVAKATDDPRVHSLVTAHCGCPRDAATVTAAGLSAIGAELARLQPMADRVAKVHRLHDPSVAPLAKTLADLTSSSTQLTVGAAVDPLQAWRLHDRVRGDLRRISTLTNHFQVFADACGTVHALYDGLKLVSETITQVLDRQETVVVATLRKG